MTVALWMLGSGGLVGCGQADRNDPKSRNGGEERDAAHDASDDTANTADAADSQSRDAGTSDAESGPKYDARLADRGSAHDEECPTQILTMGDGASSDEDDDQEETDFEHLGRIFLPSYRLDFDALTSQSEFREHIHQIVHRDVVPCLSDDSPAVVVFPDSMSLPMRLVGAKAEAARDLDDSMDAMSALIDGVEPSFDYYTEAYPGASTDAHFLLALTDTVVRATYDTFGQIADRYDLFVSVSVDLPSFETVDDPQRASTLGDPDFADHDYAFEAVDDRVHTRHLLFDPDGELVDDQPTPYANDFDAEHFGLANGGLTDLSAIETPFGATGATPGDSAWMPDVQDRLDDLGARVLLQPRSQKGGWIAPEEEATEGVWTPDSFLLGAWNLVQRSPRIGRGFVSQMTGNYFETPVDGQVQMVEQAHPDAERDSFIGQSERLHGNFFVGPWAAEAPEPGANSDLDEVRHTLRTIAEELASGDTSSGEYVDEMWAADLYSPARSDDTPPAEVQTHPSVAYTGQTGYLAYSEGAIGKREIVLESLDRPPIAELGRIAPDGYDALRPDLAVGDGALHLVFEAASEDENRLMYAQFDLTTERFGDPITIDRSYTGEWAYHPSLVVLGDTLHVGFVKEHDGANRAHYLQTTASDPFEKVNVETPLTDAPQSSSDHEQTQWDVRLAATYSAVAAVWLDYRDGNWRVLVSTSHDGGLSWSDPERLDDTPDDVASYHATPSIEPIAQERFAVAWADARADRPATRIGLATLHTNDVEGLNRETHHIIDDEAGPQRWRWRPQVIHNGRTTRVFYESLDHGYWSLSHNELDGLGNPQRTETTVTASETPKHFPDVASQGDQHFFAWEEVDPLDPTDSQIIFERRQP
ncbi:MAG: hypothetical protein ACOCV2_11130 [Persicimonas sp.]